MIMNFLRSIASFILLSLVAGHAAAVILPPPGFNPDDGSELYIPNDITLNVELFDLGDFIPPPGGFEFGFYYASAPGTQVTIFDTTDVGILGSIAAIDFDLGVVVDLDASAIQDTFTPQSDPIGFWLSLGTITYFTQSALNPGGFDSASALSQITNPSNYLLGFEAPGLAIPLAVEFVAGITPIPLPGALLLMISGFAFIGGFVRRSSR